MLPPLQKPLRALRGRGDSGGRPGHGPPAAGGHGQRLRDLLPGGHEPAKRQLRERPTDRQPVPQLPAAAHLDSDRPLPVRDRDSGGDLRDSRHACDRLERRSRCAATVLGAAGALPALHGRGHRTGLPATRHLASRPPLDGAASAIHGAGLDRDRDRSQLAPGRAQLVADFRHLPAGQHPGGGARVRAAAAVHGCRIPAARPLPRLAWRPGCDRDRADRTADAALLRGGGDAPLLRPARAKGGLRPRDDGLFDHARTARGGGHLKRLLGALTLAACLTATSIVRAASAEDLTAYENAVGQALSLVKEARNGRADAATQAAGILEKATGSSLSEVITDLRQKPPDLADADIRLTAAQAALARPGDTADPAASKRAVHDILSQPRYAGMRGAPSLWDLLWSWLFLL